MTPSRTPSLIGLTFVAAALACAAGCNAPASQVTQYGRMREVLRNGQSQPRIALSEVTVRPHAHAVGALADLDGEVTIVDGVALVSRVRDGALASGPPVPGDRATLLTLAYVERWHGTALGFASGDRELETTVEEIARAAGVAVDEPFPFVMEGELTALDMHVINGACPLAGARDEAGAQSGLRAAYQLRLDRPTRGKLVGFFATGREGDMTHHGTRTHIHAVLEHDGRTVTGHVERVSVAAGTEVRVPRPR